MAQDKARRRRSACKQKVSIPCCSSTLNVRKQRALACFSERCAEPWGGMAQRRRQRAEQRKQPKKSSRAEPVGVCCSCDQVSAQQQSKALAASAVRAAAACSASASHLSSRSGSSKQRGAAQRRSSSDRAGLPALGSVRQKVRLGRATQQQQRQHMHGSPAERAARTCCPAPRAVGARQGHRLAEAGGFLASFFPPSRISH
jgi:hypothetical protein